MRGQGQRASLRQGCRSGCLGLTGSGAVRLPPACTVKMDKSAVLAVLLAAVMTVIPAVIPNGRGHAVQ